MGYEKELKRMAQLTELSVSARGAYDIPAQAAVNSGVEMDVLILLEGLIDLGAERERLKKEVEKIDKRRQSLSKRLSSAGFRERAPEKSSKRRRVISKTSKSRSLDLRSVSLNSTVNQSIAPMKSKLS